MMTHRLTSSSGNSITENCDFNELHIRAAIFYSVKESAYKGLVCPVLEYGSSVWDPSSILLQEELEKVQKRAARFVTGNYIYETGRMTGILEQLKWESLKKQEER